MHAIRSLAIATSVLVSACGGVVGDPSPEPTEPLVSRPVPPVEGNAPRDPKTGPEVLAEDVGTPSALALAGDLAVFTTRTVVLDGNRVEAGALFVRNKKVGPALMIAVDRRGAAYGALAIDGTHAFVATSDARIVTTPLAGGNESLVAELTSPVTTLVATNTSVVFAQEDGTVARVAKRGGEVETLGTIAGEVRSIVADEKGIFVATAPKAGEEGAASIVRIDLGSLEQKTITAPTGEPCAMVKDGERLFWTTLSRDSALGTVEKVSTDGQNPGTIASGAFAACAIATDANDLFFATTTPSAMPVRASGATKPGLGLMRAPIAGGTPTAIPGATSALPQPGAVAVDAQHIYWLTQTGVLRLSKR